MALSYGKCTAIEYELTFSFSHFINICVPGVIDIRVIKLSPTCDEDIEENLTLFLNSAIAIGCPMNDFSSQDILNANVSSFYSLCG
jgi:hypothetical protein